jgi:glutamyl-tRNA reductase
MTLVSAFFYILKNVKQLQYFHQSNQEQNQASKPVEGDVSHLQNIAIWQTCLRKIIFFDSPETEKFFQGNEKFELIKEQQALQFLFEILCGLQSKVLGETEIFGQFKKFIETPEAKKISFFQNPSFVQFIFQQVKELREKYLLGLAVNSYGSLIRKKCIQNAEISLIGYGQLAQEIIPWLKKAKKIHVHVRKSDRFQSTDQLVFHELKNQPLQSVVILAAPVESSVLESIFQNKPVEQIIDCRALDRLQYSLKNKIAAGHIIELKDIFKSLENEKIKFQKILPAVKAEISERSQGYIFKVQHRPQGWEDLCG